MIDAFDEILLNHDNGDITVEHGIVALDAHNSGHINFLSSAAPSYFSGKTGGKQLLVSHEAHRILSAKMPKAAFLPVPTSDRSSLETCRLSCCQAVTAPVPVSYESKRKTTRCSTLPIGQTAPPRCSGALPSGQQTLSCSNCTTIPLLFLQLQSNENWNDLESFAANFCELEKKWW